MKSMKALLLLLVVFRLHALDVGSLYGTWESDPEATRKENDLLAEGPVTAMCDNLKEFPIVLRFNEREFSTETTAKKVTEKYVTNSTGVNWVKIAFLDPDGKPGQRGVTLKGGGSGLILDIAPYAVVFKKKE